LEEDGGHGKAQGDCTRKGDSPRGETRISRITTDFADDRTPDPGPGTPNPGRVRYVSGPDRGLYDALNKGVALATGDVVGQLNADDLYAHEGVLARVAAVFEQTGAEAVYGDLVYVAEDRGNPKSQIRNPNEIQNDKSEGGVTSDAPPSTLHDTSTSFHLPPGYRVVRYWRSGHHHPNLFYRGWMPPHPAFFAKRECYARLGGYRLDLGTSADYELMLRFLLKGGVRAAYVPEVLVCMRTGGLSNVTWKARWRANRMDRRAWEVNGLRPRPWTLLMKPLRKLPQWWRRP
jgi:glycosyltransferase